MASRDANPCPGNSRHLFRCPKPPVNAVCRLPANLKMLQSRRLPPTPGVTRSTMSCRAGAGPGALCYLFSHNSTVWSSIEGRQSAQWPDSASVQQRLLASGLLPSVASTKPAADCCVSPSPGDGAWGASCSAAARARLAAALGGALGRHEHGATMLKAQQRHRLAGMWKAAACSALLLLAVALLPTALAVSPEAGVQGRSWKHSQPRCRGGLSCTARCMWHCCREAGSCAGTPWWHRAMPAVKAPPRHGRRRRSPTPTPHPPTPPTHTPVPLAESDAAILRQLRASVHAWNSAWLGGQDGWQLASGAAPCKWHGVTCDEQGRVVKL